MVENKDFMLTGRALEDFSYKYNMSNFNEYSEVLQNALIIEWFDSVGIYVTVNYNFIQAKFTNSVKDKDTILYRGRLYSTRQEATKKALEKANEIFNNK